MKMRLLLATLAAALCGCAGPAGVQLVADSSKALQEAPVCCTTMATARRLKLPEKEADVVIDATSQAFNFDGKKAFFVLYELPAFKQPYSVTITSFATGVQTDFALFIPRITTYDGDFKLLRHFDEKSLRNRGNNLERTVFINASNSGERFIAVHGSDLTSSIERAYSAVTVTPVSSGLVTFNVYSGQDGKSTLRSSPAGKLKIETQGISAP